MKQPSRKNEERDGCFSFGALKTTWETLDGDGIYLFAAAYSFPLHSFRPGAPWRVTSQKKSHSARTRAIYGEIGVELLKRITEKTLFYRDNLFIWH